MTRRATLYRYFDRHGVLLYVGITVQGPHRQRGHLGTSPWWSLVATATFTHYPSLRAAMIAEREAIELELPVWNKMHRRVIWPTFSEGIRLINELIARRPGPYTVEQWAEATGLRADVLTDALEANGIPHRGVRVRRYTPDAIATLFSIETYDDAAPTTTAQR